MLNVVLLAASLQGGQVLLSLPRDTSGQQGGHPGVGRMCWAKTVISPVSVDGKLGPVWRRVKGAEGGWIVVMHREQAWDGDFRLKRGCRGSIPKISIYGERDGCSHNLETAWMEGDTGRALRAPPPRATAPGPQIA